MAAETHFMQGRLYSEIEEAVAAGFSKSGLEKAVITASGVTLAAGLRAYVTVLLAAFTHRGAMFETYEDERAQFGKLVDEYFSNAVSRLIQHGDIALFNGGMFFSGIQRQKEAVVAGVAYHDVAVLLQRRGGERGFFSFLSGRVPEVMQGMTLAAKHLGVQRQKNALLYMPAVERYLDMN
ncbi:MAG: hypothetical protein AABX69_02255 [Nanoarchaeota archaeon]